MHIRSKLPSNKYTKKIRKKTFKVLLLLARISGYYILIQSIENCKSYCWSKIKYIAYRNVGYIVLCVSVYCRHERKKVETIRFIYFSMLPFKHVHIFCILSLSPQTSYSLSLSLSLSRIKLVWA